MHDKVYDATKFVDEHPYVLPRAFLAMRLSLRPGTLSSLPLLLCLTRCGDRLTDCDSGGEEVLLDVGGQDATEPFEDVGHSDEAREILDGLLVGKLKRVVRV